jgi:3-phenylpropionate/trans-cinnamate dioxygenase ferredoxin subunit
MRGFQRVAADADIGEEEITTADVDGVTICLARSGGRVYAFAESCTHQLCPLTDAFLNGTELECECHGAAFDLTTGAVTLPPAVEPLPVYPVRVVDGEIWVSVPHEADARR